MKKCKICKSVYRGRKDKIFCSVKCKSDYHRKLNEVTLDATTRIDKILHRNRSILLEILGKNKVQLKVERSLLDKKNFKWDYHTSTHVNVQNKLVTYLYDISWILFTDQEVLIRRKRNIDRLVNEE
ncbi:MAG: hypothetical protein CMN33_05325 [Saprospirales bacterium]|nr:hypothetical protein [Saprospirales bacterium]